MPRKKRIINCNDPFSPGSSWHSEDCLIIDSPLKGGSITANKISSERLEEKALDSVFDFFEDLVEGEGTYSSFAIAKQKEKENTYMVQAQLIQLEWSKELSELCHLSKNLYNHANYVIRKLFFDIMKENHNYINESLWNKLYHKIKDSFHYKSLNAQTAILIVKHLLDRWIGYKKGVIKWFADPFSFPEGTKPRIPGYKPKNGEFLVIFPIQNLRYPGYRKHFEDLKVIQRWKGKNGNLYRMKTAEIKFPKKAGIPPIRFRIDVNGLELNLDNISEFRISPRRNHYLFQVVYKKKIENLGLDPRRVIGVDWGVNNLLTIVNNFGAHPIIVKGKKIKYVNWLGNRRNAKIQQELFKRLDEKLLYFLDSYCNNNDWPSIIQTFNYLLEDRLWDDGVNRAVIHHVNTVLSINGKLKESSKKYFRSCYMKTDFDFDVALLGAAQVREIEHNVEEITRFILEYEKIRIRNWKNRNNRVQDQLHKVSCFLISYCEKKNVGRIVIGYNRGWKQEVKFRKKIAQNFVYIPFLDLLKKIKYKAAHIGIEVIIIHEGYTSKCSALDFERIGYHNIYMGKRVTRGLFCSKNGLYINADVNAAFNILRVGIKGILDQYKINMKKRKLMQRSPMRVAV